MAVRASEGEARLLLANHVSNHDDTFIFYVKDKNNLFDARDEVLKISKSS